MALEKLKTAPMDLERTKTPLRSSGVYVLSANLHQCNIIFPAFSAKPWMVLNFKNNRRLYPRCAASPSTVREKKPQQTLSINIFSSTHIKDAASALISMRRFQRARWHNKQGGADCKQVLATELAALTTNKLAVLWVIAINSGWKFITTNTQDLKRFPAGDGCTVS